MNSKMFWTTMGEKISSHVKTISLKDKNQSKVITAALNSNIFFYWFIIVSNCRDLTSRDIENFPIDLDKLPQFINENLIRLHDKLMSSYKENSYRKETQYKTTGKVIYDEYYPKLSKNIIDNIDKKLSRHYNLSPNELDYIINYDIKYRMGSELEDE